MNYSQAVQCALLAQEIYQDFSGLRFSRFPGVTPLLIEQGDTDTQGAILSDTSADSLYIVFRGSEKIQDWDTNFDLKKVVFQEEVIQEEIVEEQEKVYPYQEKSRSGAEMHRGFVDAYQSVREQIHDYLKSHTASNIIVTGHSLGGALATLCAVDIQYNFGRQFAIAIYTFGSPRVGNNGFRTSFNNRVPNSYRFIYGMDIVPALPRPWQGYRHVEKEYRLGPRFSLKFLSQRFKDHAIANYIAALKKLAAEPVSRQAA